MVNEKKAWKQKLCGAFFDPGFQGSSLVHSGCSAIPQRLSIFSSQHMLNITLINHERSIKKSPFFKTITLHCFQQWLKRKHEWSGCNANKHSSFIWPLKIQKKSWKELQAKKIQLAAFTVKPSALDHQDHVSQWIWLKAMTVQIECFPSEELSW